MTVEADSDHKNTAWEVEMLKYSSKRSTPVFNLDKSGRIIAIKYVTTESKMLYVQYVRILVDNIQKITKIITRLCMNSSFLTL